MVFKEEQTTVLTGCLLLEPDSSLPLLRLLADDAGRIMLLAMAPRDLVLSGMPNRVPTKEDCNELGKLMRRRPFHQSGRWRRGEEAVSRGVGCSFYF